MKYLLSLIAVLAFVSLASAQFNGTCFGVPFNSTTVCNGNGTCIATDNCNCTTGFFGASCEGFNCNNVIFNSSSVCSGNGTCTSPDTCACKTGYTGNNCQTYQCYGKNFNAADVCNGNGTCTAPDTCSCKTGFYGAQCEAFNCNNVIFNATNVCSGNGTCTAPNSCSCKTGFSGTNCENYQCFGVNFNANTVCSGNGTCVSPDKCACKAGYSGSNCEIYKCNNVMFNATNVCSGKGTCAGPDNCVCNTGFFGHTCEAHKCNNVLFNATNVCSGNGTCSAPDTCSCKTGYTGNNCQTYKCNNVNFDATNVCSGNGTCVSPDKCVCTTGFTGNNCQTYQCFGIDYNSEAVCNGNGQCTSPDSCLCNAGLSGPDCSIFVCSNSTTYNATAVTRQFAVNALSVEIDFKIAMDATTVDQCGKGIANIVTSTTPFGTNAKCEFASASVMRLVFGTNPTFKPGNVVTFKAGAVKVKGCAATNGGGLVSANPNPAPAFASIKAPSSISSCGASTLVLDGSASSGSGAIQWYRWSMVAGTGFNAALNTTLSQITGNRASIANNLLAVGAATFRLEVSDYLGQTAATTVTVTKDASTDKVTVVISTLPNNQAKISLDTQLSATVSRTNCTTGVTTLAYSWESTSHTSLVINNKNGVTATVPAYEMTAGTTYTFKVTVQLKKGTTVLATSTATYSVAGTKGDLSAVLDGQAVEVLTTNDWLRLNANQSRDNNVKTGVNNQATFAWTCCTIDKSTSSCNEADCLGKFNGLSANTANQFSRDGTKNTTRLPLGNFRFTVTYSADTRKDTATKEVRVVAAGDPLLSATLTRITCTRSKVDLWAQNMGNAANFTSTVASGSVTVLSTVTNGNRATLLLDTSSTNTQTTLTVTATAGSKTASIDVVITPPEKASGGKVIVTDSNGNDVTSNTLNGDVTYNLVVKDFTTPSGKTVFSRAIINFVSGGKTTSSVFNTNQNTRQFVAPINVAGTVSATAVVTLRTSEQCSESTAQITFTVGKFTLQSGQTLEGVAAAKADAQLTDALNSGSADAVANVVGEVLNVLGQSSGGNATARAELKQKVIDSYTTSLLTVTEVTPEVRSAGLNIITSAASNIAEITPASRSNALKVLGKLFADNSNSTAPVTGIDTNTANSAVSSVSSLLESINFVPPTNSSLLALAEFNDIMQTSAQTEFEGAQVVLRNVVNQALLLKKFGDSYTSNTKTVNITAYKSAGSSYPAKWANPFQDGSFEVTSVALPTTRPDVVNSVFFKYDKVFFKTVNNYARLTTTVYGVELFDGDSRRAFSVSGLNPGIEFKMASTTTTTTSTTNQCATYNTQTRQFTPIAFVSAVAGTSVTCRTTHLTDFAAFNVDAPQQTPAPKPTQRVSAASTVTRSTAIMLIFGLIALLF